MIVCILVFLSIYRADIFVLIKGTNISNTSLDEIFSSSYPSVMILQSQYAFPAVINHGSPAVQQKRHLKQHDVAMTSEESRE